MPHRPTLRKQHLIHTRYTSDCCTSERAWRCEPVNLPVVTCTLTNMEVAAVLLTVVSIAIALYAYRVISFIRAWFMLRNVPSPPASGLLSGHAPQLTTLKRSASWKCLPQ